MNRIVVGVDGSHRSVEALEWAARYGEMTGSAVTAISCCEPIKRDMWVPHSPPGEDPLGPTKRKMKFLADEVMQRHPTLKLETKVIEGNAANVLEEASKGADLLVVGNRGLGGISGLLVGSVGMHCVSHAPCPVVVLREKSEKETN
jgi:nucleotide-binding universal stress UspA family protein